MTSDTPGLKRPKSKNPHASYIMSTPSAKEEGKKGKKKSNISSILHYNGVEMTADILDGLVSMQGISEIPERIGSTVI